MASSTPERLKEQLRRISGEGPLYCVPGDKLKWLLRRLDPAGDVISDAGLDVFMDACPKEANGEISIDHFVDWLCDDENNTLPGKMPQEGAAAQLRVFWSNHLTPGMEDARQAWFRKVLLAEQVDESLMSIKASMPPFNNSLHMTLPDTVLTINVPVYGPNIPNSVMRIFEPAEMKAIADRLICNIPPYVLNDMIQKRMDRVVDMAVAARKQEGITESNGPSIDRLENFAKALQELKADEVPDLSVWTSFVNRHANPGWEHRLHFDHLLDNFGFDKQAADALRALKYVYPDGEEVPYEQHAFRWLGKAFSAYGPLGCMTDVVNLVFAMMGIVPTGLGEDQIAMHVDRFSEKLHGKKDLSDLWVPSHFVMDAESDDTLSWVLLEHIHTMRGTKLQTFVQLPDDPSLDDIAAKLGAFHDVHVFRDSDARNLTPVQKNFGIRVAKT